jgi:NADPH-dependent ferric siderophore reductase
MRRVTLAGPGLETFPAGQAGGYVKFNLGGGEEGGKPVIRTYTVRHQRPDGLDIDFALHGVGSGTSGPATDWAQSVKRGDIIAVGGPGPAKPLPPGMDLYMLAGDMTALPAISVNLEQLDRRARGFAVIEIQSEEDRQEVDHPPGVEMIWLVNPHPGEASDLLVDRVRSLPWAEGEVYAWAACEFGSMRALRTYLREERSLGPDRLYISSYWKLGNTEEMHKKVKSEDAMASAA